MLELCKTRAKKSSPDMFNFYVVLAGHDIVTDTDRATTCRCKFKAPSLQTKSRKNEGHSENMGFNGKTIWSFQAKKKNKNIILTFQKPQWDIRTLEQSIEYRPWTYHTFSYSFAANFSGAKPQKTAIDSGKNQLKVFHDHSQNVNAMIRIKEIRFREEKLNALELTENLEHFWPIKTTQNQAQIQTGSKRLRTVFFAN